MKKPKRAKKAEKPAKAEKAEKPAKAEKAGKAGKAEKAKKTKTTKKATKATKATKAEKATASMGRERELQPKHERKPEPKFELSERWDIELHAGPVPPYVWSRAGPAYQAGLTRTIDMYSCHIARSNKTRSAL